MSWEMVKLGDIAKMVTGKTPPTSDSDFFDGDYIWVNPSDFNSKYILESKRTLTQKAVDEKKCNLLPVGTVLLSCIGDIGKVGILKDKGTTNQQITGLILNSNVHSEYLYYYLIHNKSKVENLANKAVVAILNNERLRELDVILPPLATQKRIAEILDKADVLRRKDQELLKKYDDLAQAIFIDMFGDPVKNEKGWEVKTINDIALKVTDGDHLTPIRSESGYKLLSCRNVKNGFIDFEAGLDFVEEDEFLRMYKRCNPEKGDILISCSGTIGRVTQVKIDEKFVLVRSAALVKPNCNFIVPTYLEYYLQSDFMQREMIKRSNTSSQANLFTGPIKALPVILPDKILQLNFADKIQLLENAKNCALSNYILHNSLFNSLLQKAFKGELN